MSILKVARLGHPILRALAEAIPLEEIESAAVQRLIDNMIETMREYEGVGLAAPQVYESKQIIIVEMQAHPRHLHIAAIPLTVLINPTITYLSSEAEEDWEGCLSINDLRGKVPRSRKISVKGYDQKGKEVKLDIENFFARVVQHEVDHLIGKVFLDRMRDFSTLTHLGEYNRYWNAG
ncbi:MAG: peptide deformylase [Candidatus Tectomicrobia bacterium]|nr:peptide deformylase [Candidatus Tectomicrobia bacterium]